MSDKPQPDPTPPASDDAPDPEATFWEKFDTHLESWFDKKVAKPADDKTKKDDKPDLGTSRTGAPRVTLATLFADAVFGPKKD